MLEKISVIDHNSPVYQQAVALRDVILRKPLGMVFTAAQLAEEKGQVHIAGFSKKQELVACLVLVPMTEGKIKMRQVAVASILQRKGIGQQMVQFSEDWAREHGFSLMYCHARDHAVSFYEKMNYCKVGEEFVEVSIPHFRMEKEL